MKSLFDPCCHLCTHSPEQPCANFILCLKNGPLCHDSKNCQQKKEEQRLFVSEEAEDTVFVTIGMGSCGLAAGAQKVYNFFQRQLQRRGFQAYVKKTGCLGFCSEEVLVRVKKPGKTAVLFSRVNVEKASEIIDLYLEKDILPEEYVFGGDFLKQGDSLAKEKFALNTQILGKQKRVVMRNAGIIDPTSLEAYVLQGGFSAFNEALKENDPLKILKTVIDSGLRGRGGAGFLTGEKWRQFRNGAKPKLVIANGHESDPAAFTNRALLESDPFSVLEGLMIAAFCGGAEQGIVYVRANYDLAISHLTQAINSLHQAGLLGENILGSGFNFNINLEISPGAFVAGEETALIATLAGERGMPKPRPPYPTETKEPILVNNCETLANIPTILNIGVEKYHEIGSEKSPGTKLLSLAGKVRQIGYIEVPFGMSLREIIFDLGGGLRGNRPFKAAQVGGPSGGFLSASFLDTPMEFDSLEALGLSLGSGSIVVIDDESCIVALNRYNLEFMSKESCGRCIPCREGIYRLLEIIDSIVTKDNLGTESGLKRYQTLSQLEKLAQVIADTSACGLGQCAPNPVLSSLKFFREEYEAHIFSQKCPAKQCKGLLTYRIDADLCKGCSVCLERCPEGAIVGERKHSHFILADRCTRCGICLEFCSFAAIIIS